MVITLKLVAKNELIQIIVDYTVQELLRMIAKKAIGFLHLLRASGTGEVVLELRQFFI